MAIALSPWVKFTWSDANGLPLEGGKVLTCYNGTSTNAPTYTSASGLVENTNPVILDASGKADIWLDTDITYKFVILSPDDAVIDTITDVSVSVGGGGSSGVSSFAGRSGTVVPASGDYDSDQITNNSTVTGTSVTDALNELSSALGDQLMADGSVAWTGTQLPSADGAIDLGDSTHTFRNGRFSGTVWGRRVVAQNLDIREDDYSATLSTSYPIQDPIGDQYQGSLIGVDTSPPSYKAFVQFPNETRFGDTIRIAYQNRSNARNYLEISEYNHDGVSNLNRYTFSSVAQGVKTDLFSTYVDGAGSRYLVSDPSDAENTKFLKLLANGWVGLHGQTQTAPVFLESGTQYVNVAHGIGVQVTTNSGIDATKIVSKDANGALQIGTLSAATIGAEPTISAGTTSQYWRGDKSWQTLDKSAVGLGNVLNVAQEPALGNPSVSGQVLASTDAGVRSWVTLPSAGMSNPMDSAGDMIVGGASGTPTKLDAGTLGYFLKAAGAASPTWFDLFGTANTFSATQTFSKQLLVNATNPTGSGVDGDLTAVRLFARGSSAGEVVTFLGYNDSTDGAAHVRLISGALNYGSGATTSGTLVLLKDSTASKIEMRMRNAGAVQDTRYIFQHNTFTPATASSADLGSSGVPWNAIYGGTLNLSGAAVFNGAVTLGDAAGDAISVNGTVTAGVRAAWNAGVSLGGDGASNLNTTAPANSTVKTIFSAFQPTNRPSTGANYYSGFEIRHNSALSGEYTVQKLWDTASEWVRWRSSGTFGAWGKSLIDFIGTGTTVPSLAGTGSRMVVADANGLLGTQAIPGQALTIATRTGSSSTGALDQYVRYTGSADATETLPAATGTGRVLYLKNNTSYVWTIDGNASETIDGDTSITLALREAVTIVDAATGVWEII